MYEVRCISRRYNGVLAAFIVSECDVIFRTNHEPEAGLGDVAVVDIAMTQQVVAFNIQGVGVGIPTEAGIDDGVGMIGLHLTTGIGIGAHAVLIAIAEGQVEFREEMGLQLGGQLVAQILQRILRLQVVGHVLRLVQMTIG